jgi:thioredoxin-related protein
MTDTADAGPAPARRKKSGLWTGFWFVALLGAGLIIAQVINYSGPSIKWIYNDVDAALAQAQDSGRRVFLYLHAPQCPITAKHERSLFNQRFARTRLDKMVPCRAEIGRTGPLRARFGFDGTPLMLVLDSSGKRISELRGEVNKLRFLTYIRAQ